MREASKTITLIKSGNRMVVEPTTQAVLNLLAPQLTFTAKKFLYGPERREAGGRAIECVDYQCYTLDHRRRVGTSLGLYARIGDCLRKAGYRVDLMDLTPPADPSIFEPQWERLFDPRWRIKLKPGQDEFLVKFMSSLYRGLPARFNCPPGYGKSSLISFIAVLLPRARIHVSTKRVPVLVERIYPELCTMVPDVGLCYGGKKKLGRRVQLFTFDSLHHSDGKADILIVDEAHEAATDDAAYQLARYDSSVNFGLSATHDMRLDNKDLRVEAMFGPVAYTMPYQEAVDGGLVLPIEVHWSDVTADYDPCEGEKDPVERKRRGLWRNDARNAVIACNARADVEDGRQTLITCETLEHALALKALLPDFELMYADQGVDASDVRYFRRQGLWPAGEEPMTPERRKRVTLMFERGKERAVIATTVWNVGVSFNYLDVLNRADGGGSPINDTQIPGRTSRHNPGGGPKTKGVVRDYKDQFNSGFRRRATSRRRNYEGHGWLQVELGPRARPPAVAAPEVPAQYRLYQED